MVNPALTMDQAAYSSVSELCEDFVRRSDATCALLVGQDGLLLHKCGSVEGLDVDGLSALSAGAFASTGEMARLIGEAGFDLVMQQGRRSHLQLIRAGDHAILVAVSDDRTTAGMVRLHGQRLARRLARLLAETEAGVESEGSAGRAWTGAPGDEVESATTPEANDRDLIGFAIQTQTRAEQLRATLRMRTLTLAVALLAAATAVLGALLHH